MFLPNPDALTCPSPQSFLSCESPDSVWAPNGRGLSRRTAETTDETGKDTLTNETTNKKTLDRAVGTCPVPVPVRYRTGADKYRAPATGWAAFIAQK
jgi:hypothetical protein